VRAVDLFSGPGGWDEGLAPLGLRLLGIEWDAAACATREAAGHETRQADVAALEPLEFAPCDLLIGSPPCQAFSTAGKGLGLKDVPQIHATADALAAGRDVRAELQPRLADARSLLVVEPLRWALALMPRLVACEQVPAVLPLWERFAEILRTRGYWTWTGLLTAEQYAVPQTRERAFLMASLAGPVQPPAPTHQRYIAARKELEHETLFDAGERERSVARGEEHLLPWISMAEALGWQEGSAEYRLAPVMTSKARTASWIYRNGNQERSAERTLDQPAPTVHFGHALNDVSWTLPTNRDQQPDGSRQTRPTSDPVPSLTAKSGGQWYVERPAPTIVTTRRSKDGLLVGRQMAEGEGENVGGWGYERPATTIAGDSRVFQPGGHHEPGKQSQNAVRVTLEEASILQGFRPDCPWQGSRTKCFEQVGNAVPPPLARAVIAALTGASPPSLLDGRPVTTPAADPSLPGQEPSSVSQPSQRPLPRSRSHPSILPVEPR
jgi:DNA (cytosine-5)-methyltransferase 1